MNLAFKAKLALASAASVAVLTCLAPAYAYPEFQQFSEKNSGRTTDCSMCHVNATGPVGTGEGQLGSLTADDLKKLNDEHAALEPGKAVESPVLNAFGNKIIQLLGRKKFIQLKQHPEQLKDALGKSSDLDDDGIVDGQEFADGTDPLNKNHGDPWRLFVVNLDRYKMHIALAAAAIVLLDFGFVQLLQGFSAMAKARKIRKAAINPATDVEAPGTSVS